jgi:hypothetical protein
MQYIIDVTFQEAGIRRQTMAWVLNQNIKVAFNGVNPRHNILCKQIAQKPGLVNDTIGELAPIVTHIINTQICDAVPEFSNQKWTFHCWPSTSCAKSCSC